MTTKHRQLLILGSGPAGYTRRRLRRPRQPQAGPDHRPAAGRPADDHHRSGQLAGRRRRRAGPRADGALPAARRTLQHRDHLRPDPHRQAERKALHPDRRLRHLHLRRADHRHRRIGHVSRPAVRTGLHGPRRIRLRHLRRLLLQEPGRGRDRRRQYRRRGSAVPGQHRQARHPGAPPRHLQGGEDHGRPPDGPKVKRRQDHAAARPARWTKCWATRPASPACASRHAKTAPPRTSR